MTDRLVMTAADGRRLDVLTTGPPDGLPLVFHNGTPGGLVAFGPMGIPGAGFRRTCRQLAG